MGRPPKRWYLPGLAEHESCVGLKSARCWNPAARLKTQREEGAGIPQITRAYTATGSLRFDALKEIRDKHPFELYELNWNNVYTRPDLQIKVLILKMKDNYEYYTPKAADTENAYAFADASYNGGIGGLDKEIKACYLTKGCDHKKWWGNVENFCMKSKVALYGNRSACDINRHHVTDVINTRSPKYRQFFK